MSDDKAGVADKAGEIARQIWLAGVGAYGRAVDEAQGRLEKAGVEPSRLFKDLVRAGEALEDEARDRSADTAPRAEAGRGSKAKRSAVEERIQRVRDNFAQQRPARVEDVQALEKKLDRMSRQLTRLQQSMAELQESAATTAPARKRAPKKAAKTAATRGSRAGTRTPKAATRSDRQVRKREG